MEFIWCILNKETRSILAIGTEEEMRTIANHMNTEWQSDAYTCLRYRPKGRQ